MAVGALEMKFWKKVCSVIGRADWAKMNQLQLVFAPPLGKGFPLEELEGIFKSKTRDEWTRLFGEADCCVTPVLEVHEIKGAEYHVDKGTVEALVDVNESSWVKSAGMAVIGADHGLALPFKLSSAE
jgi:crotonobetainyl-CoA:carnitine CoA-transferase CaiB-like acyl-CoA transferase